ncbi:MAG: thiol:disulfide interchange protein DsbA/DsbL [Gammaproteobacteria bacterium]|nr:thiol:disulfide interchange protein DsbA/DsbL [Gammaproteobacteria bacterium]
MKKFALVWAVLGLLAAPVQAEPLEGVEYLQLGRRLPVETGDKIEVREIFWYGCPHCYNLETPLARWLKTLPKNAKFIRTPGATWASTWEPHARSYYAFEAMGLVDKLHLAMFAAIHAQNRPLIDENSIAFFVAEKGVDEKAFRNYYNSFAVGAKVKAAKNFSEQGGIKSVPTLVVDGLYVTTGTMSGTHDDMMKVVDFLIKKAAAQRKPPAKTG